MKYLRECPYAYLNTAVLHYSQQSGAHCNIWSIWGNVLMPTWILRCYITRSNRGRTVIYEVSEGMSFSPLQSNSCILPDKHRNGYQFHYRPCHLCTFLYFVHYFVHLCTFHYLVDTLFNNFIINTLNNLVNRNFYGIILLILILLIIVLSFSIIVYNYYHPKNTNADARKLNWN